MQNSETKFAALSLVFYLWLIPLKKLLLLLFNGGCVRPDQNLCTGLKLENYYFFTFTFSRPEVGKLLLFYVFTFSRPEVRKLLLFYVFTFSRPEVGKLFCIYVFTFSRPEVGKLFPIYSISTWSWKIIPYLRFYFFSTWSWKIIPDLRFYFFSTSSWKIISYFDGFVQDCSNPIANSLELLQSCRSRKSKNVNME